jgi:hypothetical protein
MNRGCVTSKKSILMSITSHSINNHYFLLFLLNQLSESEIQEN